MATGPAAWGRRNHRAAPRLGAAEGRRDTKLPPFAEEHGAIDHRRQLAHVAGPGVRRKQVDVARRQRHVAQPEAHRGALREILRHRPDVFRPVAKRRDDDREHRQTVVEILAKRPRLDHGREIPMRGRDDADVDAQRTLTAEPHELSVLHDAQQPDLCGRRQLANLVEKERAAIGLLEPALAPAGGAGKAPRSWPNSSESISSGATAPQFTRQNGPPRRLDPSWMARATTSLPLPVSPNRRTGAPLKATTRTRSRTVRNPLSAPMTRSACDIQQLLTRKYD